MAMKLSMPVFLSSILSRKRARRQTNRYASLTLTFPLEEGRSRRFAHQIPSRFQISSDGPAWFSV